MLKVQEKTIQKIGIRDAYGKMLVQLGEEIPDLVVLDADLSGSTKTAKFGQIFPDRFFNMGVSEQDMIGTAAGLAAGGKLPFVSTFAIFETGRAWEQIRQSVCLPNLNVKLVASHGGITVGEDGGSHHCIEDIGLMRLLPNMSVIIPADAYQTEKIVEYLAKVHKGPAYMRTSREKFPVCYDENYQFTFGKATLVRAGQDVTIIAIGIMLHIAREAAEILANEKGIQARLLDMTTIKPIDVEAIEKAAQETKGIITAEEHSVIGGLGEAVASVICQRYPTIQRKIGVCDHFSLSGKPQELMQRCGLTVENIVEAALEIVELKS